MWKISPGSVYSAGHTCQARHGRNVFQTLSTILAEFYISGARKLILQIKKTCPGCLKISKKSFSAVEADIPDILKTIQLPFSYCQVDIFGPILAHNSASTTKCWVLVVLSSIKQSNPHGAAAQLLHPEHYHGFQKKICSKRNSLKNLD